MGIFSAFGQKHTPAKKTILLSDVDRVHKAEQARLKKVEKQKQARQAQSRKEHLKSSRTTKRIARRIWRKLV